MATVTTNSISDLTVDFWILVFNGGRVELLQQADPVRRPVGEEGLADDPLLRDRAPEAAVLGVRPVRSEERRVGKGSGDRRSAIAGRIVAAFGDVAVFLAHGVAEHVAVDHRCLVPGS